MWGNETRGIMNLWRRLRYNERVNYTFAELLGEIQASLDEKLQQGFFSPDTSLTVLEGFTYMPIQSSVGVAYQIGGPAVPVVGAVGNNTGKVYYFPLKVLVPRVELG
jgi:hypothetical protein